MEKKSAKLLSPFKAWGALFQERVTIRTPFEHHQTPPRYRGFHINDLDKCIGCGSCARICGNEAIRMVEALCNLSTPTISVVLRKGFGLAYQAMNTSGMGAWGFYSWPGAEIGFMDPDVGVNVAYSNKLQGLDKEDRETERQKNLNIRSVSVAMQARGLKRRTFVR
jgi:ferredoxin